jgi:hypothetical protein
MLVRTRERFLFCSFEVILESFESDVLKRPGDAASGREYESRKDASLSKCECG